MRTPNNEAMPSSAENDPLPEQQADVDENAERDDVPSEVAMRISLLGKLIIPPTSP